MPYNRPLNLKVAGKDDFAIPVCLLALLVAFAAALSPAPVLMIALASLFFGTWWVAGLSGSCKRDYDGWTLVIFENGQISLESDGKETIKGSLAGQQWCTHQVAVLSLSMGDTKGRLVVLSAKQQMADDFRRLNMWLRQGICSDTRDRQVPGIRPVRRV